MPITLKKDVWKVKDPSSGQYRGAAILSTTLPQDAAQIISESNATIQNIKDTAIDAVDTALNDESTGLIPKAEADRDAIDDSLNNVSNGIIPTAQSDRDDIDDSLNNIEDGIIPTAQANLATIAAAVQSQIGQGTDKTLSVAKGFADAKAAGMLVKVSDYQPGSALDDPATSSDASKNTGYPVYKDSNRVWVKETYAELEVPTMDDIDELKSTLDDSFTTDEVQQTINVDPEFTSGIMDKDGIYHASTTYQYTQKISVKPSDIIKVTSSNPALLSPRIRFITAYADTTVVSAKGTNAEVGSFTVPDGINNIIITVYVSEAISQIVITRTVETYKDAEVINARVGYDGQEYPTLGDAIRSQIGGLSEQFDMEEFGKTYRYTPMLTNGYYMGTNGVPAASSNYSYSQSIAVQPGDIIRATRTDGAINARMRFVCAYSNGAAIASKGSSRETQTYTVPDGIDHVVITVTFSNNIDAIDAYRDEKAFFARNKAKQMGMLKVKGNLADGESLVLPYENVKNNVVVTFSGRITSFNSISIGKNSARWYVTVNNTQLIVTDEVNSYTVEHGLTIADDIAVTIESSDASNKLKRITIESKGVTYTYTNGRCFFGNENGRYTAISNGSSLTDCVLSWTSRNVNNLLWMFGDSYFSIAAERWTYYLLSDGFTAPLISGYSGENAQNAIKGLKTLLSARVPENVLWCLGMNNGDTSSAVNTNWMNTYNELINLSKEYGFNVILATIPNTPSVVNKYKNAIVRESGYQFIDFSAAVNVGDNGAWISGALSSDNVHPTATGAKILYRRALADCPQLASIR